MRFSILLIGAILLLPTLVFAKVYIIEQKTMQIGGTGYAPANDSELAINVSGSMVVSGNITMANSLVCTAANGLCAETPGNTSWNQTYADTLYYPLSANPAGYLTGYTETDPFYNRSWNETLADSKYLQSVPYQSSAAGWTNTTATISTPYRPTITYNGSTYNAGLSVISNDTSSRIFIQRPVYSTGDSRVMFTAADSGVQWMFGTTNAAFSINRWNGSANLNNLFIYDSGVVVLRNNTAETMRLDAVGNVGIGTTNPRAQLEMTGDISIPVAKALMSGVYYSSGFKYLYNNTGGAYYSTTQGGDIFFSTFDQNTAGAGVAATNRERLRINNSGAVGIGTTAPTATLDVRALNTGTPNIVAQATAGQTAAIIQLQDSSANNIHRMFVNGRYLIKYTSTDGTVPIFEITRNGNSSGAGNPVASGVTIGRFQFSAGNGSIDLAAARIDAVTTQAFNSTGAGTDHKFYTTSTNSLTNLESMTIVGTGTVDIKRIGLTITPTSVPVLGGSNTFQFIIKNATTSASDILAMGGDNSKAEIQSFSGKPLYINRQGNSVFFPGTNTNIGIGQSTATQRLDVNGSINISGASGKLYLPNIPGTGRQICINETDMSLFRNTTCP